MKTLLKLTSTALLLVGSLSSTVFAQARPAIIQDRDQAGRNYYFANNNCNQVTFGFCGVTFPAPPAGKRLIITHISILNLMPAANTITSIDLRYLNGQIIAFLPSQVNPAITPTANYTTNESVFAKFDPGEQPQVLTFVNNNNNFQMVVSISGYMIDIP